MLCILAVASVGQKAVLNFIFLTILIAAFSFKRLLKSPEIHVYLIFLNCFTSF